MDTLVVEKIVATGDHVGDDTAISQEACREEHDAFFAEELGQFVLQLYVDIESTVEERRTSTTGTILVDGAFGGLFQTRIISKTKIGIGTEHKYLSLTSLHIDFGVLLINYKKKYIYVNESAK